MPDQLILTAPIIGQTENALRALLVKALDGSELDYYQWVALRVVSTSTPPLGQEHIRDRLQEDLRIDQSLADEVIDSLAARGLLLVAVDGVTASDQGSALYQRLDVEVRRISAKVWKGIDGTDLAAAYRVLAVIMARANDLLAG
jgi:DNA-binding MarR family transcriptional regulator